MKKIGSHSQRETLALRDTIREALRRCDTLEKAAQSLVKILYGELSEEIVLVRFFVTLPHRDLPKMRRNFVETLMENRGSAAELSEETPVLSLLGSRGEIEDWNDVAQSKSHLGIPLASTSFVEAIPMIARLLQELEVKLDWLGKEDGANFTEKELSVGWMGTFYVRDATSATDARGRHVITDQDFVARHGVKTVFGLGGIYPQGALFTLLFFTRETIEKTELAEYSPLAPLIISNTSHLLRERKIFTS